MNALDAMPFAPLAESEMDAVRGGDLPDLTTIVKGFSWLTVVGWVTGNWKDIESGYSSVRSDKL